MARRKGFICGVIALAALIVGVDSRAATAQSGQWTNGGLSESFNSVTVDPSDPWRLYSLTSSGAVFTSDDAGANWSQMDEPLAYVSALAVSPTRLASLYAFDFGFGAPAHARLFRSSDNGVGWSLTSFESEDDPPRTVAVDPTEVSTIYAGTYRGLSKSTDGGATWEKLKLRETETRQIYDILFPPRDPATVYVVDADYSYYPNFTVDKTTDGGRTWKTLVTGPALLVIDLFDPSHLYGAGCPYAYRSTDAGATWTSFSASVDTCNFADLVADPVRRGHLYAGRWRGGVLRSRDGGTTWEQLGVGIVGYVTGLAIDPAGLFLHASTAHGVLDLQLGETRASPCESGTDRLCLLGGRFEVSVKYGDVPAQAVPQGDRFGSFRRPGTDPTGPEIFVKMADRRASPNRTFWFFHGSVTDLGYTITVTDTATGRMRFYRNEPANPGCGAADTGAFVERSAAPASQDLLAGSNLASGDGETLSLLSGRFQATLSVRNPFTGTNDSGLAMPQTDGLGYFSFPSVTGDPAFPEVFVSIFEPRPFERTFSHTGLTNLQYTLTVTDRETGAARVYQNRRDDVFNLCGGFDFTAFD
jgi:photosystem II stability/assembly factor-like uncharacterized protein